MSEKQYDNELCGALFKNNERRNDKDPDYRGQCEIDRVQYWISAWINESRKDGSKFMSLRFTPKQTREHKGAAKNPPDKKSYDKPFDDEVPF